MIRSATTISEFWFGDLQIDPFGKAKMWWNGGQELDEEIRERFAPWIDDAGQGRLGAWTETPTGTACLVVVLDQFPRNAYRGTARAFAYDGQARTIVETAIDDGTDLRMHPVEAAFLYMPLMHSEDLGAQDRCIERFAALVERAPEELKERFAQNLDYAQRHRDIVERFGRFPHRNAILDRESTAEEVEFLKQPGSSF